MEQIRNTYPLSGFRILIASYANALNSKTPIEPKEFVLKYAKNQFGLDKKDAQVLSDFIFSYPELITNGKPTKSDNVKTMLNNYDKIRNALAEVNPSINRHEFNHLKLMADLRMLYLNFQEVVSQYNSKDYKHSQTTVLVCELDKILKNAKKLNKIFIKLNKGFLYYSELKNQNELRIQPIKVLYNRLVKLK